MAIYVQMNNKSYRKGVGIIIVNSDLQFFLGKRIGADAWQFPQGGIDEGETPEDALYRELYEETNINVGYPDSQTWVYFIQNTHFLNN